MLMPFKPTRHKNNNNTQHNFSKSELYYSRVSVLKGLKSNEQWFEPRSSLQLV